MGQNASYDDITALQRELQLLEEELAGKAQANPQLLLSEAAQAGGTPPQVSGMAKVTDVGAFTVSWNKVAITDLLYYEVQWSTDATFLDAGDSETITNTRFTPPGLAADTTYYVRVRAVNQDYNPGAWSSRVSSKGGVVLTANIDTNATSEIHTYVKTSGFTLLNSNGASETYGPVTITVADSSATIAPKIAFEIDFASEWVTVASTMSFTTELLRRPTGGADTVIDSATTEVKSTLPIDLGTLGRPAGQTARMTVPTFVTFDQPGAGSWEYRIRVTTAIAGASNVLEIQGVTLNMEFTQSKR